MSAETAVDPTYHSQFRQHVHHTSLHVRGLDAGPEPLPLPPFYTTNPASYWTSSEKAAFFHGLSVYSRLRPDLIAEDVRTKSTLEVCSYMNRLDEGLRSQREVLQAGWSARSTLDSAVEVTEKWIEWEEVQSRAIVANEVAWDMGASEKKRTLEFKAKKQELLPRTSHQQTPSAPERKEIQASLGLWLKQRKLVWAEEDLLSSMGAPHFTVIDNILREEEDAFAASVLAGSASHSRQTTAEPAHTPSVYTNLDDSAIDPLLRDPPPPPQSATSEPTPEPGPSLETLSPASRKRVRKRLYMRRKRAEAAGLLPNAECGTEDTVATAATMEGVQREKPGRKGRPRKKQKTDSGSKDIPDQEDLDDNDAEDEEPNARHSHIPGKTLHYKIKGQLASMGWDAQALHAKGLGLFHLAALAKYTRLYVLLHPETDEEVASKFSADFIKFLHAHIVQYVTELMHRAIASREQERVMKGRTKVWRFDSSNIFPATIEHAREMMGDTRGTRETFFAQLLTRFDIDDTESHDGDGSEEEDEEDEDQENTGRQLSILPLSPLPLPRAMCCPLIQLPSSMGSSSLRDPIDDTLIMGSDSDEEAELSKVLQEEEALEAADQKRAEQIQRVLWGEYGPKRKLPLKVERADTVMRLA
ncbi:hypothetical protein HWV62_11516 [Athelia sp. TMB]|nr:hypothetical protein HWV62_11516 [Athelia sp. TMB]